MKKLVSLALALIAVATITAQQPVITFEKTTHDFGKINEADGNATTVFNFKNEGASPLVLNDVRASCGCTTPSWPRTPIAPGQTGQITVTYKAPGRPGRFQKTITVKSNATESQIKLYIKGEVIPKPAKPVDNYPVKMGSLSLKANTLNFGQVFKDSAILKQIDFANLSKDTIVLTCMPKDEYIYGSASMSESTVTILPNTKGSLFIRFDALVCPKYGPVNSTLYLMFNGANKPSEELAIAIQADIREDFSHLTAEQRAQAPIASMSKTINLGTFTANKRGAAAFHVGNAGPANLIIRRLVADTKKVAVTAPKSIRSGKKGTIKVTVLPAEEGNYSSEMTVITNDPANPIQTVTLNWTIEK